MRGWKGGELELQLGLLGVAVKVWLSCCTIIDMSEVGMFGTL